MSITFWLSCFAILSLFMCNILFYVVQKLINNKYKPQSKQQENLLATVGAMIATGLMVLFLVGVIMKLDLNFR